MSSRADGSEGYPDAIFTGPVMSDLKCAICLDVMKNAQRVCENDHLLCLSCAKKISRKTCHICRKHISIKPAQAVNRMILQLPVKCYASDSGCVWKGELGNLEDHMRVCGYVDTTCSFAGCGTGMQRRLVAEHEATCGHRLVTCDYCSYPMKSRTLNDHKKSKCSSRPVMCDKKGCGVTFSLNLKRDHALVCPLEVVHCPHKDLINCSFSCVRREMNQHAADISCHFMGLVGAVRELKDSNDELLESNDGLKQNVADLEEEIVTLKKSDVKLTKENSISRQSIDKLGEHTLHLTEIITRLEGKTETFDFLWEIPYFNPVEQYNSPPFVAFGHTLGLLCSKERERDGWSSTGFHSLFLTMLSNCPVRLVFKFTFGRYGMENDSNHSITYTSSELDFTINQNCWGCTRIARSFNLTRNNLLTASGTLQIKATIYKVMS